MRIQSHFDRASSSIERSSLLAPGLLAILLVGLGGVVGGVGGCSSKGDNASSSGGVVGPDAGNGNGAGDGGGDGDGGSNEAAAGGGGGCPGHSPYVPPPSKTSTCAGTAAFAAATKIPGPGEGSPSQGGEGVAVGDLDGDGKLDFATTEENKIFLYFGKGDGTFESAVRLVSKQFTIFTQGPVLLGDFDGDGKLDVSAAGGIGGSDSLYPVVWLNSGGRVFGLANQDSSFSAFQSHPDGAVHPYGNGIAADLDGDGSTDLVYCGYGVRIYTSHCGGGLSLGSTISFNGGDKNGYISQNCQVTKLNDGDAIPDLIIQSFDTTNKGRTSVLHGNGDGSFGKEVDYENSGQYAVLADVDNDKVLDIVLHNTADNATDTLGIMKGKPDGTFALMPNTFPVGAIGWERPQIVTADFNSDGKVDVVIADGAVNGRAHLLRGNGDGTFMAETQVGIAVRSSGNVPAVADFDNDGLPDLLVGDGYDASVSLNRCH